jgi:hypothetical protein
MDIRYLYSKKDNSPDIYCMVCINNLRDTICRPCGHSSMCHECLKKTKNCPICTTFVDEYNKVLWCKYVNK